MRRRAAMTMVELLVTMVLFFLLLGMIWGFFRSGRRTLESTSRKLDAAARTHVQAERLRHDLLRSPFAWVPPPPTPPPGTPPGPGGSHRLYAGSREVLFDPEQLRLLVGGALAPGHFRDVRFFAEPRFRVKYSLTSDEANPAETGKPGFRERSTLVSGVFMEAQAEDHRHRRHVWEDVHRWCVQGAAIHYGFED